MSNGTGPDPFRADVRTLFLGDPGPRVVLASKADSPLTCVVGGGGTERAREPLVVRVATSEAAAPVVTREAMLLVELRRRRLGPVEATIPRHVGTRSFEGLPVSLESRLPGHSMARDYHQVLHTARPRLVRHDYQVVAAWLAAFQDASSMGRRPSSWVAEVAAALERRWAGSPMLAAALAKLEAAGGLDDALLPATAVHGDFVFDNVLVDCGEVSGVVGWADGAVEGSPLRDLVRFVLAYSRSLDTHVRPRRPVAGHPGLRRVGAAPGIRYALTGASWYPRLVRSYLAAGVERLGLPPGCWYDAALVGVGEIAAGAREQGVAADHLAVLAALPERPVLARMA